MEVRRLRLPGNRILTIRPLTAADASGLKELFAGLNEEDVYARFFSGRPPPAPFIEKMARRNELGGFGVVATIEGPDQPARIVAEATYTGLPGGDAELGITVDRALRGWFGPYLLDILVDEARRNGVPNIQAEVLATNPRMLALLEARGSAVLSHDDRPATTRLCIGTAGRRPAWPSGNPAPRLLVEATGGRWRATREARQAGFTVIACPGDRPLARCPVLDGKACPLAEGADLIVDALPGSRGRAMLYAHRQRHPGVPICVDYRVEPGEWEPAPRLPSSAGIPRVVEMLQKMARPRPDTELTFGSSGRSVGGVGSDPSPEPEVEGGSGA